VAGAVAASEELVGDLVRVLGQDHPDTLTARANLARWRGEAEGPHVLREQHPGRMTVAQDPSAHVCTAPPGGTVDRDADERGPRGGRP
jgi:hypothetical protein